MRGATLFDSFGGHLGGSDLDALDREKAHAHAQAGYLQGRSSGQPHNAYARTKVVTV